MVPGWSIDTASTMRLPHADVHSRRSLIATVTALAVATTPQSPAFAKVDGIPLYAPGDAMLLPDAGFETYLPMLEVLRDVSLPSLKVALSEADWTAAAQKTSGDILQQQSKVFGATAALLGDEAYTALQFKSRYTAAAKRLQRSLAEQNKGDAELLVNEMDASLREFIALIPKVVVDQVRAREKKLAAFSVDTADSSQAASSAASSVAPEPVAPGGFLSTPTDAGKKRCGIDIRC